MDLRQLEYFVRVAELGSFTKAAATLDMSQPVLSRQVRRLEVELGKHLLYRNGRGVTPTEAGKRLLAHGKGILHQMQLARNELDDEHVTPVGKVVIGLPPTLCKRMAVPLIAAFRDRYPQANIGIVEGLTVSMQEWLLMGRLDMAVLYNPALNAQLEYEHLCAEPLCLISPRKTPARLPASLSLRELGHYPLVLPSLPNAIRTLIETECARQGLTLKIVFEVDAIGSVLDIVEQGYAHAVLSRDAVEAWNRQSQLRVTPIASPAIVSQAVIATAAERPLTRLAEATVELIRAQMSAATRGAVRTVNKKQPSRKS